MLYFTIFAYYGVIRVIARYIALKHRNVIARYFFQPKKQIFQLRKKKLLPFYSGDELQFVGSSSESEIDIAIVEFLNK